MRQRKQTQTGRMLQRMYDRDTAKKRLEQLLMGGPTAADEVMSKAAEEGLSAAAVNRAVRELGVVTLRVDGKYGLWWSLPSTMHNTLVSLREAKR